MKYRPIQLLKTYLARQYARLYPKDLFVAVSGCLDRTTCVTFCVAVLSQKFKTISNVSSDSVLSISSTLLKLTPNLGKVVLEMDGGADDMDFNLSLISPKTVIFTRICLVNPETSGSLDDIIEQECKLVRQLDSSGTAILNFDDPTVKKLAKECGGEILYYGTDPQNCTFWAGNIKLQDFKTTFELNLGVERVKVNLQLLGLHQVYPSLAAAALGIINDIPLTKIKLSLESVESLPHCMQVFLGPNGSTILDDTLNSSPVEVELAIDTLLQLSARRRILVLGEMPNLGKYSDKLHRQIAQKIFKEKIDLVFLGQGEAEIMAAELNSLGFLEERISSGLQNSQMVSKLLKTLAKGDVVLIKGSHSIRLDEVVKRIARKT